MDSISALRVMFDVSVSHGGSSLRRETAESKCQRKVSVASASVGGGPGRGPYPASGEPRGLPEQSELENCSNLNFNDEILKIDVPSRLQ